MRDLYREVTDQIVAELKTGVRPWVQPWSKTPGLNIPCNAVTGHAYRGVNLLLLWTTRLKGWPQPRFGSVVRALIDWPKSETPLAKPNEVVPAALRTFYRWGPRHDRMAARVMQALGLRLPDDRAQIYAETWLRIRPKKLYPDGRASIPEVDAADIGPPLIRKTRTD